MVNYPERWSVELHPEVKDWFNALPEKDHLAVAATLEILREDGPRLGRPLVDTLEGSRHHNMKELRPPGGSLRLLFVFDPARSAIVLVAGDKANNWKQWYKINIAVADDRYDERLAELDAVNKEKP